MRYPLLPLLLLPVLACGGAPAGEASAAAAPSPEPAVQAQSEGDEVAQGPAEEDQTAAERMRHHFRDVVKALDSVIHGDLDGARAALGRIEAGEYGMEIPQEWIPALTEMQLAAGRGVKAKGANGVARAVASVGRQCGECHRTVAGRSVFGQGNPDGYEDLGQGVESAMARHQWALAQLWLGLTSPRHADWQRGADALSERWQPVPDAPADAEPIDPQLLERIEAVRALGPQLHEARTAHAREQALADLLVRCSSCHTGG